MKLISRAFPIIMSAYVVTLMGIVASHDHVRSIILSGVEVVLSFFLAFAYHERAKIGLFGIARQARFIALGAMLVWLIVFLTLLFELVFHSF